MEHDRRGFLTLGGATALGLLAGCQSGTQTATDEDGTPTATATRTVTQTAAQTATATATPAGASSIDYGGWFEETSNYDGTTVDATGQDTVTVEVGAPGNGGNFAFAPPAVRVSPGTTVRWKWTGKGGAHNVVARDGTFKSGPPTSEAGVHFEYTFESEGLFKYYCAPHRSLGMRGAVVVGSAGGSGGDGGGGTQYGWQAATFDSYWYSLYNMSTNIAMSGNGVLFPHNQTQKKAFKKRMRAITKHADVDRPPINNPNLNMAPFTTGDPHFTQKPVFEDATGRPNAATLAWDKSKSSRVVSPASVAWTHLKGVTWAKNFEKHFEKLPTSTAPKFRSQVLTSLAQLGVKFSLVDGKLRKNDDNLLLASTFSPKKGIVDGTPRLGHHTSMLWFLSNLTSLAKNGWFGYRNPRPLIPAKNIQKLTDGMAKTTMNAFSPSKAAKAGTARDLGLLLGGVGWYGTHAGVDKLGTKASQYANGLAKQLSVEGNGRVAGGAENQAATQGAVGQGLVWASQLDGVDHTDLAGDVLGYLFDELWDGKAGTFASGTGDDTYTITARDAGDIVGGINAAKNALGRSGTKPVYATFFDETFNDGLLQRAQRPVSVDGRPEEPPVPPKAGGKYGQASVYNAAVAYDTGSDEWSVTDDTFRTADALYLANQHLWISHWGGDFYQGNGIPGKSDEPPA